MPHAGELWNRMIERERKKRRTDVPPWDDALPYMDMGAQLRELRTTKRLTQARLATASGVAQSEISRIEARAANPTLETLEALARALKVRVAFAPLPVKSGLPKTGEDGPPPDRLARRRKR